MAVPALAGCGGGGSDDPAPPPCIPVAVVVELSGDSISSGAGTTDPAWTPEAQIRAALVKRWPTSVSVVLTGKSGTTSFDRINGGIGYQPFPAGVVGNVYVTNFGVNDARQKLDVAAYKANIRKIASVPGAVLQTPTPMDAAQPKALGGNTAAYAQAVREVGLEMHVPVADVQAFMLAQPNWQLLMTDGVHWTDAGYRLFVPAVVLPVIEQRVAALRCGW